MDVWGAFGGANGRSHPELFKPPPSIIVNRNPMFHNKALFIFSEENAIRKYAKLIIEWGYPFSIHITLLHVRWYAGKCNNVQRYLPRVIIPGSLAVFSKDGGKPTDSTSHLCHTYTYYILDDANYYSMYEDMEEIVPNLMV